MKGKKTGGRQKGTKNVLPGYQKTINKQAIADLLSHWRDSGQMQEDFDNLDSKTRMFLGEKLMQYVIPKMQAVTVNTDEEKPMTIEAKLKMLAQIPEASK